MILFSNPVRAIMPVPFEIIHQEAGVGEPPVENNMCTRAIAMLLHRRVEDNSRRTHPITIDIVFRPARGRTVDECHLRRWTIYENHLRNELFGFAINQTHDYNLDRTSVTCPDQGMAIMQ